MDTELEKTYLEDISHCVLELNEKVKVDKSDIRLNTDCYYLLGVCQDNLK